MDAKGKSGKSSHAVQMSIDALQDLELSYFALTNQ